MKTNNVRYLLYSTLTLLTLALVLMIPGGASAETSVDDPDTTIYLPLVLNINSSVVTDPLPGDCMSSEEALLADLVNNYRNANGLPDVPVSKTMMAVGQWHVLDLETNHPDIAIDPVTNLTCNLHSWSDWKPSIWSPVCYTDNHANASGMWVKPMEISNGIYNAPGYENAYWDSWRATAVEALSGWKYSPGHNAVILEQNIWAGANWAAMGMGIYEHYAVLWFGSMTDPQGTVSTCP